MNKITNTAVSILSIYVLIGCARANANDQIDHKMPPLEAPSIEVQYDREISTIDHKFSEHKIDKDIKPREKKVDEQVKKDQKHKKDISIANKDDGF